MDTKLIRYRQGTRTKISRTTSEYDENNWNKL